MLVRNFLLTIVSMLIAVALAYANNSLVHIKVISEQTRRYEAAPEIPPNCNWKDLSAYCFSSAPQSYVEHKLLVEDPGGHRLEIACTAEQQYSSCASLPANQSFEARKKKDHGLEIRYKDQHGKTRKQLYRIVEH